MLNYQVEKLDALRNILLNSMFRTDIEQEVKEYLLNVVENLTNLHIRLVRIAVQFASLRRSKSLDQSANSSDDCKRHWRTFDVRCYAANLKLLQPSRLQFRVQKPL
jgi:hypothetical protein